MSNLEKGLKRLLELRAQLLGVLAVEIGATIQAQDLAPKLVEVRVVLNLGLIAVNGHDAHGTTPCCSSRLRTLVTAPLSVPGDGCGR